MLESALSIFQFSNWNIFYQIFYRGCRRGCNRRMEVILLVENDDSDVGDTVMLVTLWWCLISDVGGRIIMLATFFVMLVIFLVY